ncbi:NADH-quinone oxidoreductase subunit C [Streptomyces griseocarneus]|uniref:NADH-quinone oxidoreductase subunit C n=1 Tax=Streptomyces griseocarneus TaxID=51201 RepID=UPI00167D2A8F|nr:NADH-quinone oxidoreductase subunit C [Streptomyces griseocarneus]MBZ6477007.1 NADH-quinone oxidoreductase subunit C [Streptomyces griseocarneus]GHG76195.1 dehydrogenase [Streptomyces griseocarneus]
MTEPTLPPAADEEPTAPEPAVGWLPGGATELFGEGASAEEAYGLLTVDVPADAWITALETARDRLGCTFFDWLSAVDEPGTGFRVCAHVAALPGAGEGPRGTRRLLLRTTVPHDAPALPTAVGVYAGAAWHERETHEMFGVGFTGHPHLVPLLLPENFEGHPLRKDFVLAARVVKAWPGAKEPGESAEGGPKRRQMLPPGVPDPNEWGPLKGQLPPAPARPTRTPRAAAGAGAGAGAGAERPVRRARSVAEGSASQAEGAAPVPRRTRSATEGSASQAEGAAEPAPRRTRSAADGSASQAGEAAPRRTRSAADGSASQGQAEDAAPTPRRTRSAADGSAGQAEGAAEPQATRPRPAPRSSDAPWHHARPAFEEPQAKPAPETPASPEAESEPAPSRRDGDEPTRSGPAAPSRPEPQPAPAPEASGAAEPAAEPAPAAAEPAPGAAEPRKPGETGNGAAGNGEPENDTNPAGGDPA